MKTIKLNKKPNKTANRSYHVNLLEFSTLLVAKKIKKTINLHLTFSKTPEVLSP